MARFIIIFLLGSSDNCYNYLSVRCIAALLWDVQATENRPKARRDKILYQKTMSVLQRGNPNESALNEIASTNMRLSDVGTNSFHLFHCIQSTTRHSPDSFRAKKMVRLRSGFGRYENVSPEAIDRGVVDLNGSATMAKKAKRQFRNRHKNAVQGR